MAECSDLATQLGNALAACELLRSEFTVLIDQVQDFFTSTEDEVDFTRPDGVTIQIPSLDKVIRDFEDFQASAITFYAPIIGAAARNAESSLLFEVYVDTTTGDDSSNDGLTEGTPYKTLKKAFSVLRSGFRLNRVFLKSGETYVVDADDIVTIQQAQLNILGYFPILDGAPDTDNTIIDASGVDLEPSFAAGNNLGFFNATQGSVFSFAEFTMRSPHYSTGGPARWAANCFLVLTGAVIETLNVQLEIGTMVNDFDGPGQSRFVHP